MFKHEKPEPVSEDLPKDNAGKYITNENLEQAVAAAFSSALQTLIAEGVIEWKQ